MIVSDRNEERFLRAVEGIGCGLQSVANVLATALLPKTAKEFPQETAAVIDMLNKAGRSK